MSENSNVFYNVEAENTVLANFLRDNDDADRYVCTLTESDFYNPVNSRIFAAIRQVSIAGQSIELPTVIERLKALYVDSSEAVSKLFELVRNNMVLLNYGLKQSLGIVKDLSAKRQLYLLLDRAKEELRSGSGDTASVLESTRQSMRDMVTTGHEWKTMGDVLAASYSALEDRSTGKIKSMPSGIKALDKLTTGFHRGELTVIGARPAVGKSAFAGHVALMAAQEGYKVGIVSREMTDIQYGLRILTRGTGIENNKLRTGDLQDNDWDSVVSTMVKYSELPISFLFSTRYIEDLRLEVQNKVDAGELDILIVDYMQLLQSKTKFDADYLRIAYVSKALKDITVDLNIAVIALAQVGRSAQDSMPSMSELRGSGDIEQDADNIIFMHRPKDPNDEYVYPDDRQMFEWLKEKNEQYIVLNVAKQRQGEIGSIAVTFDPSRMRYASILRDKGDQGNG